MRRYLPLLKVFILLVALTLWARTARLHAAPPARDCPPGAAVITSPQASAVLSGLVQVEGAATLGDDFQYYKLEFAPAGRDNFTVFSGLIRQRVAKGQLGVWDSASVPDGMYSLRLQVVDTTGNFCQVVVNELKVQNTAPLKPTETPTPVETEAPAPFSVVPTGIPTIQIGSPTEPAVAPTRAPRPEPGGTPTPGGSALNTSALFDALGEIGGGLVRTFLFGALVMAGLMLIVGVIFYVRRGM